jgi:hypothetical protein
VFYTDRGHGRLDSEDAAVLEPEDSAVSNTAVREDVWVRIPPAAPISWSQFECCATPPDASACTDVRDLDSAYVYLLGLYLGDGCISRMPKNVWRLRITLDRRYPLIVGSCSTAIRAVADRNVGTVRRPTWLEIYNDWKHWPCLFPQYGPGPKHLRAMLLAPWQQRLVDAYPRMLVRGLIHSDGCRVTNRIRRPRSGGGHREYSYPRYFFTNASPDIRALFQDTCQSLGVDSRRTTERNISIARRESVLVLDSFIGPKR